MKLKLDENIPESLLPVLAHLGHDTDNVRGESLIGQPDPDIWTAAQENGRFLITQDLDFSDVRLFTPGTHEGILLVRLRVPSRRSLIAKIQAIFQLEDVATWARCFVVATDHKIRVRKS